MAQTLVWAGNSIGSGWNTETGSLWLSLVGGETLVIYTNGVSLSDQGMVTLTNMATGATVIPPRWAAAFNPFFSSGATMGGYQVIANVAPGLYRINPFNVTGGSDGIVRVYKGTGFPAILNVRTAGKLEQQSSSQTITVVTAGNVFTNDVAFGGRCHENSVGSNDTITPPAGWTSDIQYLNGSANLPTDVSHYVAQASDNNATLSATWTSVDPAITDTSAAVLVLVPNATAMSFTTLPQGAAGTVGGFVTMSCAVTGASGTPTYQWYMDGQAVGAQTATTVLKITKFGLSQVYVVVTDSAGSIQSYPVTVQGYRYNKALFKRHQTPNYDNSGLDWFKGALNGAGLFDPSVIVPPTTTARGVLKEWNGTTWVTGKPRKVWNGTAWVSKPAKYWSAATSSWITCT